jgi:uncharacterized protein (DUF849 family)
MPGSQPEYLEMTHDFIFRNTYKDLETIIRSLGAVGTRFEFECYDVGHLYNLAYFLGQGVVEPSLFVQTIFGIVGLAKGQLAESNADQMAKIVRILRELSLEIATADEARQMLALKGAAAAAVPEPSSTEHTRGG